MEPQVIGYEYSACGRTPNSTFAGVKKEKARLRGLDVLLLKDVQRRVISPLSPGTLLVLEIQQPVMDEKIGPGDKGLSAATI